MDIASVAAAQGGVFSRAQARAAGWSCYRINRRVALGEWVAMYGGRVLHPAATPLSRDGLMHAAVLATGPRSALAGPSAATLHGIDVPWPTPVVLVPPTSRREPAGITALRDVLDDDHWMLRDTLPMTTRPRTVLDCLVLLPEPAGRAFLDRALQQRWISFDELVRRTQERVGRRGVPRLRRHVRVAAYGVRSEAERRLRRLLVQAGVTGWVADWPLMGVGVLDVAFPDVRLAIEVDGRAWHCSGDRFQHDRTRQNALVARGWTVLRFTWADLVDRPGHVVATVRATLRRLTAA